MVVETSHKVEFASFVFYLAFPGVFIFIFPRESRDPIGS